MKKKVILFFVIVFIAVCGYFTVKNTGVVGSKFSDVELIYENSQTNRYYYNHLSNNAKIAYTLIVPELYKHTESIEIPRLSDSELEALIYAISYDNPDLICFGSNSDVVSEFGKHSFVPTYTHSLAEHQTLCDALNKAVDKIYGRMPKTATDYQKELYIHDCICDTCKYADSGTSDSGADAYDALVTGQAVCEGYSRAAQLLLNKAGIDNYLVTGESSNSDGELAGHMWNVVRIGGENYYLDVTWDDLDCEDIKMDKCYLFFNVNEKMISKDHFDIVPSDNGCLSLKDNYYERNGGLFDRYDEYVFEQIQRGVLVNTAKGDYSFEMVFTTDEAYNSMKQGLLEENKLLELMGNVNANQSRKRFYSVEYITLDSSDYLRLIFS